jgi:hypothetical protein
VLGHDSGAAGLGHVVVAKGGGERHVAVDKRCSHLVYERGDVLRCNKLAGCEVAVEDYHVRMLVVEDRVDHADGFQVSLGAFYSTGP